MRNSLFFSVLLAAALGGSVPAHAAAPPRYQVHVLNHSALGATQSMATAINELGYAVGQYTVGNSTRPFLWTGDQMQPLSLAPGDAGGVALGINRSNWIVGYTFAAGGAPRPTLWHDDTRTDLTTVLPGIFASGGTILAINDAGVLTGNLEIGGGLGYRYDLNSGEIWLLADRDTRIYSANAINGLGNVVGIGAASSSGNRNAAVIAKPYDIEKLPDNGSGNQVDSYARGINDKDKVVGQTAGRAALWAGGSVTQIFGSSNGGSEALDINNLDEIVGVYAGSGGVLYKNGTVHLLDSLVDPSFVAGGTRTIQIGHAINDASSIAGYGLVNGVTTAMILTPVPEPNTVAMLTAGSAFIAAWVYRLRRREQERSQAARNGHSCGVSAP